MGQEFRELKWFVSTPHCQCPRLKGRSASAAGGCCTQETLALFRFWWFLLAVTETLALELPARTSKMWPHLLAWASLQRDGWFPEHLWKSQSSSHINISQLSWDLMWLPQHYLLRKSQRPARLEGKEKDHLLMRVIRFWKGQFGSRNFICSHFLKHR